MLSEQERLTKALQIDELAKRLSELRADTQIELIIYLIEGIERIDESQSIDLARGLLGYLQDRLHRVSGYHLADQFE